MLFVGIPWAEKAMSTTTTGGTPYGASHVSWNRKVDELSEDECDLARALGKRIAEIAKKLDL
jgi:NAD(P)H dehydrogenase (quinone)